MLRHVRPRIGWFVVGLLLAGAGLGSVAAGQEVVPPVKPKGIWDRFVILVWQYKTDVMKDLPLYREVNLHGFHVDRGAGREDRVTFARENNLPYYNDHAADKGYLHLTERTGRDSVLRKSTVVPRPNSLVDPKTLEIMKDHLRRNISVTKNGPVVAYAFDDEVSLGSFNSPSEVDGSPLSVADYRRWLGETYGSIQKLNATWRTSFAGFDDVQPVSFESVRGKHTDGPFAKWNLAPWMDWRSYMDTQFAECLVKLTRYANSLDPATPAGFVGGQQAAPYGGYDYSKVCKAIQWIESYDIGGSCEILRSLWRTDRRPYVQTWFSTGDARLDAWFLWYYLLHGNRGVIAWPDRDGSWFHYTDGKIAPFIRDNAETIKEVQGPVSEPILDTGARWDADGIAVYYSHPSVQATWAMDVVPHGSTWPRRSSSLDNKCQSAGKNRVAWFKLLEDCGFQHNVVTGEQIAAGELIAGKYRVLICNRVAAMSDAEGAAVRAFVEGGGTVIADHLTGVLTAQGVGRPGGGALDELFGIRRDESKGYLGGGITEINGERYSKPFLERLMYDGALRHEGIVVYERGTKAAGGQAAATVGSADVIVRNTVGKGRCVYLNLTPMVYYDLDARLGAPGEAWRALLSGLLAESGLTPRARALAGGKPIPLAEVVYWRKGSRVVVGLVKNPTRQGSITGVGKVHGVTGEPVDVTLEFAQPVKDILDLRTGRKLPDGKTLAAGTWKPWEALLFQVTMP
ncbi:MAG TPA: beta-galactosidase trimerization domain-containing protein [Phycisphaerae bacterium]|nr:beta-galactosidase trimerization domain-containing protein [Phycisphaerae bacterium]